MNNQLHSQLRDQLRWKLNDQLWFQNELKYLTTKVNHKKAT